MNPSYLSRMIILVVICIASPLPVSGTVSDGSLLVAVYTAGNSLESSEGLITDDISQMIAGLNETTGAVELLVAYGGANKTGWHGMTVASSAQLREDLQDGVIGNETFFLKRYPDADMGNGTSLSLFLSYIRDEYRFDRVFLILIGHGQAYTGMLFDENHGDNGLTVAELVSAFQSGGYNVDLLGIDSCLMSCTEVASGTAGYAGYMIASEESEPAAGWEYEPWIRYLAGNPGAAHEDHARVLFDAYMADPEPGKTLSLLDLSKIGLVTRALDQFSQDLTGLLHDPDDRVLLAEAIASTCQFGLTETGEREEATLDLYDLAIQVRDRFPYLETSATGLVEAVDETVILSRHDGLTPGAHGLSILSPVTITSSFFDYYRSQAAVTPAWDRFIAEYLSMCDEDRKNETPGESIVSGSTMPQIR